MDGGTGMERKKRSCDDQVSSQDAVVLLVCSNRYNVLKANPSEVSRNVTSVSPQMWVELVRLSCP